MRLRLSGYAVAAACVALALLASQAQTQPFTIVPGLYVIKQVSSGRVLTTYRDSGHDFRVVTRNTLGRASDGAWAMTDQGDGIFTFTHASTSRFLDAHEIAEKDFHLVTRPQQTFDRTQLWKLVPMGDHTFTFMQVSSGRFMDAHEHSGLDFGVVTRPRQDNPTQLWRVTGFVAVKPPLF